MRERSLAVGISILLAWAATTGCSGRPADETPEPPQVLGPGELWLPKPLPFRGNSDPLPSDVPFSTMWGVDAVTAAAEPMARVDVLWTLGEDGQTLAIVGVPPRATPPDGAERRRFPRLSYWMPADTGPGLPDRYFLHSRRFYVKYAPVDPSSRLVKSALDGLASMVAGNPDEDVRRFLDGE